ncbi:Uncharacterised protein [Enterobacter kobei]|nr:Uncharacterised protein [Enterobacter kobei]
MTVAQNEQHIAGRAFRCRLNDGKANISFKYSAFRAYVAYDFRR